MFVPLDKNTFPHPWLNGVGNMVVLMVDVEEYENVFAHIAFLEVSNINPIVNVRHVVVGILVNCTVTLPLDKLGLT